MGKLDSTKRPPVRVRIAALDDAEGIATVINSAFRLAEGSFVNEDRIDVQRVVKFLAVGKFLLAESEGILLGCVYVEPRLHHDATAPIRFYLGLLAVDPARQQFGLGSVLMQEAEEYCRGLGAGVMEIKVVHLREQLFGFYRRRGYVETGISPFPPEVATTQHCHFVEMSKQLRPAVTPNREE